MPAHRRTGRLVLVVATSAVAVACAAAPAASPAAAAVPSSGAAPAVTRAQGDAALADLARLTRTAGGKTYRVGGSYSAGSALTGSISG